MRKGTFYVTAFVVLLGALFAPGGTKVASAEVQVNVNIGPPPIVVAEPPEVILVPRTEVYFVPDPEIDVFFYGGYWWSPRGDRWYRARAYNGPWVIVSRRAVPGPVIRVPRDYRVVYAREKPIPYGQWKKHRKGHDKAVRREEKERGKEKKHGRGHDRD